MAPIVPLDVFEGKLNIVSLFLEFYFTYAAKRLIFSNLLINMYGSLGYILHVVGDIMHRFLAKHTYTDCKFAALH